MTNIISHGKVHLITLYYVITHDLILQSLEIFSLAIVPKTVFGNDKKDYYVML